MKPVKLGLTVALWLVVFFMAYKLYKIVEEPVTFDKDLKSRSEQTQDRLLDIKVAQDYYKQKKGFYTNNFDELINMIQNEKLTIVKTNGDPDDTAVVVTYDTIMKPIIEEILEKKKFKGTKDLSQLKFIPNTDIVFDLATDTIQVQRVQLSVFEAKATKDKYLSGLDKARIANPEILDLSIGSLVSASGKGSWE